MQNTLRWELEGALVKNGIDELGNRHVGLEHGFVVLGNENRSIKQNEGRK